MIPISDNIRNRNQPIINYWLIGISIVLFFWELRLEFTGELGNFINIWGVIPAQISQAFTNALFSNSAAWIVVFLRSVSLLSSIFLHGSFSQILGNMLFLWVFGKTLENALGSSRYLGFYLAAGVLTGVIQILIEPSLTIPVIGANGAIAAVLGAYIIRFPKARIDTVLPLLIVYIPIEVPILIYIFWWFLQQGFYGMSSLNISPSGVNQTNIFHWSQVAGLLMGAAFMRFKQSLR